MCVCLCPGAPVSSRRACHLQLETVSTPNLHTLIPITTNNIYVCLKLELYTLKLITIKRCVCGVILYDNIPTKNIGLFK